jgi:hypothetical protein
MSRQRRATGSPSHGLNLLHVMHVAAGDLGRIVRIVRLLGFTNTIPTFSDYPKVVNGCSDLSPLFLIASASTHVRRAVSGLCRGYTVEFEAVVEIAD